jgi:Ca-activated chloride channel homolog
MTFLPVRVGAQTTTKPSTRPTTTAKPTTSVKPTSTTPSKSTNVELILDASGSMYAQLSTGGTRIAAAKEVLTTFISQIPANPDLNVGLRIYGATAKAGSKEACVDSKLVLPMKGIARAELSAKVTATQPKGSTPIAYSLEQAALDFPTDSSKKLVVLVTDGIESCDGNPKKAFEAFKARGITVDLRIVGIDLDEAARKSFEGLGTFENTKTSAELAAAIGRATADVAKPATAKLPVTVTLTSVGKPVSAAAKVRFINTAKQSTSFNVVSGTYKADLPPGVYTAEVESAEGGLQTFSGLTVAVGAPNAFAFEIGTISPVKLDFKPNPPTAGGKLMATFAGAPNKNQYDWVAISVKSQPDGQYYDSAYVKGVSGSVELNVPDTDVQLELRYHAASPTGSSRVVGRSPTFSPKRTVASLDAPTQVTAGSQAQVKWTGPNNQYDYVTIVKKGAPEGTFTNYQYTSQGNPATIKVPLDAGEYEFRYSNDTSKKTLASRPVKVVSASYSLDAPASVVAGSNVTVKWTGPNNQGDYITIVKKGAAVGTYTKYQYTSQGNPVTFVTPGEAGEYELRYSSEAQSPNPTLATRLITLTKATYGLSAPASVKAGADFQVKWTGPNNDGDYVTIVKKGAPVGTYAWYVYTRSSNPLRFSAPAEKGQYELRYMNEGTSPNPTLFSLPITVN